MSSISDRLFEGTVKTNIVKGGNVKLRQCNPFILR